MGLYFQEALNPNLVTTSAAHYISYHRAYGKQSLLPPITKVETATRDQKCDETPKVNDASKTMKKADHISLILCIDPAKTTTLGLAKKCRLEFSV